MIILFMDYHYYNFYPQTIAESAIQSLFKFIPVSF